MSHRMTRTRPNRPGRRVLLPLIAAASAVALSGCSLLGSDSNSDDTKPAAEPDRTVQVIDGSLPDASIDTDQLPYPFAELPAFDTGWEAIPTYADGVFVGLAETDGLLKFSAVDAYGTQLWQVERPAACSGYVLVPGDGDEDSPTRSSPEDAGVAILTDAETTDEALSAVTATAYDLRTGEERWGPAAVPGPFQGPGPVFASAAPASAMGAGGPRQALDPLTGEVIAGEADDEDLTIVGVYDDVLITATGEDIRGQRAEPGGEELWQLPAGDLDPAGELTGAITALAGVDAPAGYALLTRGHGTTGGLIDTHSGDVINTGVRDAGFDHGSDHLLTLDAQSLAGFDDGEPAWSRGVAEDMELSAAGGVLAYLRSESSVLIVNTMTGEDAVAYPPDAPGYAVPIIITASGAAIFSLDEITLLGLPEGP